VHKKQSVILAERHPTLLEGIRGLLETLFDYVVMVADEESLREAIERLRPDLVVIDLSFPITRERNVARWLRKNNPWLRFIVLSVDDDRTVVDQCMASGASGLVLKRSIVTDLIPAVTEVLQGNTYASLSTRSPSAK
jgi:DNA-binding NarL/FixJ family response regulator